MLSHCAQMCRGDINICRTADGKKIRVGEGGTGTVYKAVMHGCDEVALKLIKTREASQAEHVRRQREVSPSSQIVFPWLSGCTLGSCAPDTVHVLCQVMILRLLRHKHIVQFYGACLAPDSFFIVTELMTGVPRVFAQQGGFML